MPPSCRLILATSFTREYIRQGKTGQPSVRLFSLLQTTFPRFQKDFEASQENGPPCGCGGPPILCHQALARSFLLLVQAQYSISNFEIYHKAFLFQF